MSRVALMPIEDPTKRDQYGRPLIAGARLQVDEVQAKAIRKISSLYAGGLSIKSTTKRMNADKIASLIPRAGRQHSWSPSSIRGILVNERYRGAIPTGPAVQVIVRQNSTVRSAPALGMQICDAFNVVLGSFSNEHAATL